MLRHDFLFIQGLYPPPKLPHLPGQVAGNHGCGIVTSTGPGTSISVGTPVAFSWQDAWAEEAIVPEQWLIPLPLAYPLELAAQFFNVVTAWDLLDQSGANSGDLLLVTAARSAVSQLVIQLAARRGIDVVGVARRGGSVPTFSPSSFALVQTDGNTDPTQDLRTAANGRQFKAILDSVGGPVVAAGIALSEFGAKIILYGAMTAEPFAVSNLNVLLKDLRIGGFTYRFFFDPPSEHDRNTLDAIIDITSDGSIRAPLTDWHSIDEAIEGVREAVERPGGKRAIRLSEPGRAFA